MATDLSGLVGKAKCEIFLLNVILLLISYIPGTTSVMNTHK